MTEESATAERAWQIILDDAAGPGTQPRDREAALAAARKHLEKQEVSLREFIRAYPEDPHRFSARIRLAAVLASRGRLIGQPAFNAEAMKSLATLESDPSTPGPVRADAGFARVTQAMEDQANRINPAARDDLQKQIRKFMADHAGDRRVSGLMTELATLYDDQPTQKKKLLDEANALATDPALRGRIGDDLRRIGFLGHVVPIRFETTSGAVTQLPSHQKHVVVLLFWASWSLPSLHEMVNLQGAAQVFANEPVDFLTVSLDEDRHALAQTIEATGLHWPVDCDGRGWKGELVRSLGINALPTVWVFDRAGNLTVLNVRGAQTVEAIRKALAIQ